MSYTEFELNAKLDMLKLRIKAEKEAKKKKRNANHEYLYGITVDRVKSCENEVTKLDLLLKLKEVCSHSELSIVSSKGVKYVSFEWKLDKKFGRRIHLHSMVITKRIYVPYSEVMREGWSIKIEKLKHSRDMIQWAAYMNKEKIHGVDVDSMNIK